MSTFRKVLVGTLTAALAFTGLTASPASAAGVTYATGDSIADQSVSAITDLDANGQVTIPAGVTSMNVSYSLSLAEGFFTDNLGKTISLSRTITGPNNTVLVQNSTLSIGGSPSFSFCEQNFQNCANTYSQTPPSDTMVVKANQVSGSASLYTYLSSYDQNSNQPLALAAGTYKFEIVLKADGVVVPVDGTSQNPGKVNLGMGDVTYSFFNVNTYTLAADIQGFTMEIMACVDSAKISAGDVLTPTFYLNGNAEAVQGWDVRAVTRSGSATNARMSNGQATTFTVNDTIDGKTFDDVKDGMAIRMNDYKSVGLNNLTVGSTYEWNISIINQNNVDVTGSCKPTTPGKPTLAYNSMQNRVTATITEPGNFSDMHVCLFYKSTDLNTIVATSYAWQNMPNTPLTCSLPTAVAGTTYVVKVRAEFYGVSSDYTALSDSVLVPAPGYTVSPAVSGVTDVAGKVSVVSTDIDHITASSFTRVTVDGKGGAYRLFQLSSGGGACPPNCGPPTYTYVLKQTTASGYVSDFAGTGAYTFNPTGSYTYNANPGWYGSDASKWSIVATNTDETATPPAGQIEVVQGTAKSATVTTIKVNKAEANSTCTEAFPGSTSSPSAQSTSVNGYAVNAPSAKQLFVLLCYQATTMADNSTAYLSNSVLVSIDGENALTVIKAMGEFSNDANAANAVVSVNPSAISSDVMMTFLVTKRKVTASLNGMETATIAGREIVRIKGDLSSTVTTAAWGDATGNSTSAEPQLSVPQVNNGDFFVVQRVNGMPAATFKLGKVSATGVMGATVDITNDKSADLAITNFLAPLGVQSGSAASIQLVGVAGAAMPNLPTKVAVLSVNTTTGAGKAGEIVTFTQSGNMGLSSSYILDPATNDVNWWFTDSAAGTDKMSIYKWRDHLYVKPAGPVPAVTSKNLEYATNTPAAGTKVTFTGTNLNLATAVKFGTVAATIGTKTATSLEVTVPAGTGTVAITIESANGNGAGGNFTYVGANKVAQNVTLDAGAATAAVGDADRTLSATVSMVGYTAVPSLTYSSTTTAVCTVTGAKLKFVAKGTCTVKATQAGSSWTAEGSDTKSITVAGTAPVVSAQVSGKATNTPDAGLKLTIAGSNLGEVDAVKFGTVTATIGTRSATSLEVTIPASTKGTVDVNLVYSGGTVKAGTFEYVGASKVTQAVTLDAGGNTAAVGDADRTLSATVSMTGYTAVASITYSSTTTAVCTVTGAKLKFVAKGTCTVKATQAGSSWTAEGVATKDITVTGPDAANLEVAPVSKAETQVFADGFFLSVSSDSTGKITFKSETTSVCTVGSVSGQVVNIKASANCKIKVSQAQAGDFLGESVTVAYRTAKLSNTAISDANNADAPVVLGPKSKLTTVLAQSFTWNKSAGKLTIQTRAVWVGPITAKLTFSSSGKQYSCVVNYGLLKKQSSKSAKAWKSIVSPKSLCSASTSAEKAALNALKKDKTPIQATVVVIRDAKEPTTYGKGPKVTQTIYLTLNN